MRSISGDPEKTRVSVLAEKPVFRRHMKSRAEGAARDLKGGELIKTVLDAESVPISANKVYHAVVSESRYICE
jgi:hypothetical protein